MTSIPGFQLTIRRADGFFARLKGLMFESSIEPGVGLWIDPCRGIHTFFMRFSIDVIFLSRDLRVVKLCPDVPPNQMGPFCREAASALECRAGFITHSGIRVGQALEVGKEGMARSIGTRLFSLLLAGMIAFYAAVGFFPCVQTWYMKKFHPGRLSFAVWAPMQLVPSMYSFENRLEVKSSAQNFTQWTNHYPMRPLFFRLDRSSLKTAGPIDVELCSQYRDRILKTRYRLQWTGHAFEVRLLAGGPDGT